MAENRPQELPIRLAPEQVPEAPQPLQVLRLGERVVAPEQFLQGIMRAVAPAAELKGLGDTGARVAYDGHRQVAFTHPAAGESRVFASLEALPPGEGLRDRARAVAARLAHDISLFPQDGTQVVPLAPMVLAGSTRTQGEEHPPASEYLAFVRLQRRIAGVPVFGPGTRAMIAVAGDDSIRACAHRWRVASPSGDVITPRPREEVLASIRTQLAASAQHASVRVDNVQVGYYDGGHEFLQPVYRFEATIAFTEPQRRAANRHVFGYVPIGEPPEPLPVLGVGQGDQDNAPREPPVASLGDETSTVAPLGDPTVGRYVVRNDTHDWVISANEFLAGLTAAQIAFGGPLSFTASQYYWAEPFQFVAEKDRFVNSVHIALNEVHGNWHWFSTRDNNDDGVTLSDIPASGYGGGGGGALAYWIIHSCEVIPTQTDEAASFEDWWNIFNGLHAVVGYRTEMWINDHVTGPFGFFLGLGAPVVPAWLGKVASDDSYQNGRTYYDSNRGIDEPMGRPSGIVACGHSDDTAGDVGPLDRATCLTEWWFNN